MNILYFIPHVAGASVKVLADAGLAGLIEPGHCVTRSLLREGPGGEAGIIVADGSAQPEHVAYKPDLQQWERCGDEGRWVGYWTDSPPLPQSLLRDEVIDGHLVKLGDGNEWLVPAARSFARGSTLPQSLMLGPNGELVKEAIPRFARFGHDAELIYKLFQTWAQVQSDRQGRPLDDDGQVVVESSAIDDVESFRIATDALGMNYRLTKWECSALRLLDTSNIWRVAGAIIDLPSLTALAKAEADAKKNAAPAPIPDLSCTVDGHAG